MSNIVCVCLYFTDCSIHAQQRLHKSCPRLKMKKIEKKSQMSITMTVGYSCVK